MMMLRSEISLTIYSIAIVTSDALNAYFIGDSSDHLKWPYVSASNAEEEEEEEECM